MEIPEPQKEEEKKPENNNQNNDEMTNTLYLTIGGVTKSATLVDNSSAKALVAQLQKGDIKAWVKAGGGDVSVTLSLKQ